MPSLYLASTTNLDEAPTMPVISVTSTLALTSCPLRARRLRRSSLSTLVASTSLVCRLLRWQPLPLQSDSLPRTSISSSTQSRIKTKGPTPHVCSSMTSSAAQWNSYKASLPAFLNNLPLLSGLARPLSSSCLRAARLFQRRKLQLCVCRCVGPGLNEDTAKVGFWGILVATLSDENRMPSPGSERSCSLLLVLHPAVPLIQPAIH